MNSNDLRAELVRHNLSIPAAANLIGIGKKAFYCKIKGESQFKQSEIRKLKEILSLSDERVSDIFFADQVS
ncbi:MAG: toxin-antitoxin system, antitoxin component, Xre family protein [Ruminiclostridium sp.]|nr:toxin-antitoxin system, antitoxin component, Xre family protein [Ruminiclostridium sp.]